MEGYCKAPRCPLLRHPWLSPHVIFVPAVEANHRSHPRSGGFSISLRKRAVAAEVFNLKYSPRAGLRAGLRSAFNSNSRQEAGVGAGVSMLLRASVFCHKVQRLEPGSASRSSFLLTGTLAGRSSEQLCSCLMTHSLSLPQSKPEGSPTSLEGEGNPGATENKSRVVGGSCRSPALCSLYLTAAVGTEPALRLEGAELGSRLCFAHRVWVLPEGSVRSLGHRRLSCAV